MPEPTTIDWVREIAVQLQALVEQAQIANCHACNRDKGSLMHTHDGDPRFASKPW